MPPTIRDLEADSGHSTSPEFLSHFDSPHYLCLEIGEGYEGWGYITMG